LISTNTYKALIITTSLSIVVVLLGFTIHIKKKSELVAETYFEMDTEELEEEELEELEALLKSFDNITTNEAFNETSKQEELEDAEFEKRLEKIRNRNNTSKTQEEPKKFEDKSIPDENPAFKDIINKRSEKNRKNANKNSSISYSLVDREHTFLPTPVYLCEYGGIIVINITVNHEGNVIDAYVNSSSASSNGCLIDSALEYARASQFNPDATKASQLGTITFLFKGKN
jgi:TonB family protein